MSGIKAEIEVLSSENQELLKQYIISIPDFPIPGINFKDITPLLAQGDAFSLAIDEICFLLSHLDFDAVVAIESRGFIIGAPIAHYFRIGFVIVRKPGKLPNTKDSFNYTCEYRSGILEIHQGVIKPGLKYLIIDDVLATGGTAGATADYIIKSGGKLAGFCFLIELSFLQGRTLLKEAPVLSLLKY